MKKGTRVSLHAATCAWMQGDRFGVVVGFGRERDFVGDRGERFRACPVRVRLDSGRVRTFHPSNLFEEDER